MPEDINVQKNEATGETDRPAGSKIRHAPPPDRKFPVKAIAIGLTAMVVLATGWFFFGPRRKEISSDRHSHMRVAPVSVATATIESVPIEIRTTGNIQPYSVVNVVPQVGGQLKKVYFTQGQMVKTGDLLFQIDPRPYQASLDQAEGNLAKDVAQIKAARANLQRDQANVGQLQANKTKDEASLHYANVEYQRYKSLVQQGAISMEQADQTMTSAATATAQIDADNKQIENAKAVVNADLAGIDTAKGTVEADQAAVENAKLQLSFCTIRSPIDGRIGSLSVYEGNVVAANNATALVTIAQVQPIYVSFTIPEDYLDQVRNALNNRTLTIQAMLEGVATNSVSGAASFLENTVNTTSGTALLRATFANNNMQLYPGQFVDVLVTMPPDGPSVVVPASAIQTTQKGNAVYVVHDGKVELVAVDLKRTFGDSAALGSGVNAGDVVVTDGQLALMPGASVKIVQPGGKGHRGHHGDGQGQSQQDGTTASSDQGGPPDMPGQQNSGWGGSSTSSDQSGLPPAGTSGTPAGTSGTPAATSGTPAPTNGSPAGTGASPQNGISPAPATGVSDHTQSGPVWASPSGKTGLVTGGGPRSHGAGGWSNSGHAPGFGFGGGFGAGKHHHSGANPDESGFKHFGGGSESGTQ
ncbi:MAG TPA: efflux RND transporter periplasmic adaptor subunit [Candidatus Obscuribacterales bacterium]